MCRLISARAAPKKSLTIPNFHLAAVMHVLKCTSAGVAEVSGLRAALNCLIEALFNPHKNTPKTFHPLHPKCMNVRVNFFKLTEKLCHLSTCLMLLTQTDTAGQPSELVQHLLKRVEDKQLLSFIHGPCGLC